MAVVGFGGFETNTQHADYESMAAGSTVVSSDKRTGTYSMETVYDGDACGMKVVPLASATGVHAFRFYLNPATAPTTAPDAGSIVTWTTLVFPEESATQPILLLDNNSKLVVWLPDNTLSSVSAALSSDWTNRVEILYDRAATTVKVYLNGNLEIDLSGITFFDFSWVSFMGHGVQGNTGATLRMDDWLWRNDTALPGAGQSKVVAVTSNGDHTAWTGTVTAVDDAVPTPNDADYVNTTTASAKESFRPDTAANLSIDGTIRAVQALIRHGEPSPTAGMKTLIRQNDTDTLSTGARGLTSPEWCGKFRDTVAILTGPFGETDWDEPGGIEVGGEHDGSTTDHRMHTAWVSVDWVPAVAGEMTHELDFITGSHAFNPSEDTWINGGSADTNNDSSLVLDMGQSSAKAPGIRRTLMEFDATAILDGATIRAARLSIKHTLVGSGAHTFQCRKLLRADWQELEATWNDYKTSTAWTTAGADSDGNDHESTTGDNTTLTIVTDAFNYLNMKAILVDDADNPRVRIRLSDEAEDTRVEFQARNTPTATNKPVLVVQADGGTAAARRIFIT